MDKIKVAKAIAGLVVGASTSQVVKQIISNNVTPDSVTDKAAVIIASHILGAIGAMAAKDWSDAKIDEVVAAWTKFKTKDVDIEIV